MLKKILLLIVSCVALSANAQLYWADMFSSKFISILDNHVIVSHNNDLVKCEYIGSEDSYYFYQNPDDSDICVALSSDRSHFVFIEGKKQTAYYLQNGNSYSGSYSTPSYNNNNNSGYTDPKTKTCSYCKGKGWVAGSRNTTYGINTPYYCSTCGETVNASHSHDQCPSCGGRGAITTTGY